MGKRAPKPPEPPKPYLKVAHVQVDFGIFRTGLDPWGPPVMGHTGYSRATITIDGTNEAVAALMLVLRSMEK